MREKTLLDLILSDLIKFLGPEDVRQDCFHHLHNTS